MTVRPATGADLVALDWLDEGSRLGLAAAVAAGPAAALVLGAGRDRLDGVLAVDLPPWRDRVEPWLWTVDVRPDRRGRGLGTALLERSAADLTSRGHESVELSVADGNGRARSLYERLGWRPAGSGVDPGPTGPEPWTRMRLALPAT